MAEPMSSQEAAGLRDAMKELTAEFKSFRTESAATFVRQDVHRGDLALLTDNHNKDIALITQMLSTMKEALEKSIGDEGLGGRVKKIEDDGDWLKKIIYGAIIVAILASVGIGSAATAGVFSK